MNPRPKDDCYFCNTTFQDQFLIEFAEQKRMIQRLTYMMIATIALLSGLGIIQLKDILAVQQLADLITGGLATFWQTKGG